MSNDDHVFKVKLNSEKAKTFKVKLNKTDMSIGVKGEFNSNPTEDIYYDEVIYYDGGGADGWL